MTESGQEFIEIVSREQIDSKPDDPILNGHGHWVFHVSGIIFRICPPYPRVENSQQKGGHATRIPQKHELKVQIRFELKTTLWKAFKKCTFTPWFQVVPQILPQSATNLLWAMLAQDSMSVFDSFNSTWHQIFIVMDKFIAHLFKVLIWIPHPILGKYWVNIT